MKVRYDHKFGLAPYRQSDLDVTDDQVQRATRMVALACADGPQVTDEQKADCLLLLEALGLPVTRRHSENRLNQHR